MTDVIIYTDGACSGNPGPGGWAAILTSGGYEKELSGADKSTTNNKMELLAVINGLKALNRPCRVTIVSDSSYVCNAINLGWLSSWKKKNFMTKDGERPNTELWRELDKLMQIHDITFEWVKGHNGHPYNERCDALAVKAYKSLE